MRLLLSAKYFLFIIFFFTWKYILIVNVNINVHASIEWYLAKITVKTRCKLYELVDYNVLKTIAFVKDVIALHKRAN